MVFLLLGYVRLTSRAAGGRAWLGSLGLTAAVVGAILQQMKIGIHPEYFNHNSVYHIIQFIAFGPIFATASGLEKQKRGLRAGGKLGSVPSWKTS